MFESIYTYLHQSVVPLGAAGVFAASLVETVIAPVPSAFVLYTSGFLFLSDLSGFNLFWSLVFIIAIPAALGATIGSYLYYFLAYYFGKPAFEKWGKWLGVSWKEIEDVRKKFDRGWGDEITLGILRSIPIIPSVALSALSGIIRMRILSYSIATFLGSIIRGAILAVLGAGAGTLYLANASMVNKYENYILAAILLFVVVFIAFRIYRGRQKEAKMVEY
ncbi:MAG: hypothetical protein A2741_00575 [Candidatus Zambryskibacteria bacterium RIFCSPHIGHO2_01_FULL_43_27]|uniref:VTT domain-containing protein n=1 Tax=Candidatus Zambryskibacteria bacterium RIFCSPLOWO2_01_FULL_43_17 TaxID=1802760 RepID=A0A1G2U5H5_9BACT|nr:MAG: hypothetical protein A2741_00575 [Candidatus Zambryskibacteria bacterium RIFCSPHIGHO2_01_FULL_43_27]OHA99635.1 MAG: hypothetical protein A3E93_00695 [Candidatus Zambryskibacteria bacterium RIFCSPHIGHO2_12_FULL_43_12b]OHB04122.1 MAG: hypothetical protein A2920_02170 [Candidatus Zambryskibacteria bacterium RIFCSPLOWO2_01_FULL_43_17]